METQKSSNPIYRIDKFVVPEESRDAFLAKTTEIYAFIKNLPGVSRSEVLERTAGVAKYNFVALIAWDNNEAMEAGRQALANWRGEVGYVDQKFLKSLRVDVDFGNYSAVAL